MNLKTEYKNSYFKKGWDFLFTDNYALLFSKSKIGRLIPDFSAPGAWFLALIAISLLWYERLIEQYISFLGNDFLPPILLFIAFFITDKSKFVIRKYHLWYLIFLLVSLLAGFVGIYKFSSGWELILGWLVLVQFGLALLVGENLQNRKVFKNSLLLVALPMIAGGFYQLFIGAGFRYSYLESAGLRLTSFIGNPNIFGFLLVLVILLAGQLLIEHIKIKKYIMYLSLIINSGVFILFLTGSRTAWLALGASLIVLLALYKPKWLIFTPFAFLALLIPRIQERITLIFRPEYHFDSAIDGRIWSLANSFYIFSKNPLGTGPGTYGGRFARDYSSSVYLEGLQKGYPALLTTDNQYLAILVQGGVFGLLSFLGFWLSLIGFFWKQKKAWGLALVASFLIMMMFSNTLEFGLIAVPFALLIGSSLREND
jgi:O-antigen ligase